MFGTIIHDPSGPFSFNFRFLNVKKNKKSKKNETKTIYIRYNIIRSTQRYTNINHICVDLSDPLNVVKTAIKIKNKITDPFTVNKGLYQGACIFPILFKTYAVAALEQYTNIYQLLGHIRRRQRRSIIYDTKK